MLKCILDLETPENNSDLLTFMTLQQIVKDRSYVSVVLKYLKILICWLGSLLFYSRCGCSKYDFTLHENVIASTFTK